jgi:hypothetical protein
MHSEHIIACERFDDAAWLLLSDELDDATRAAWERHLAGCAVCAAELADRRRVLDLYDGLAPAVAPGVERLAPTTRSATWRRPLLALAAGLLLVAGGALGGLLLTAREMERRLSELEVRLAVARIDGPAAAERLDATTAGAALVNRDPRILISLLDALEDDPSPNVRMAAIDALYEARATAPIEARFPVLLEAQASPIVRIALIELAADRRLAGTIDALRRTAAQASDETVRQRARWAIAALTHGA